MFKRFWLSGLLILLFILTAGIGTINYYVDHTTKNQLYSDINLIPKNKVGLLLGTAKYTDKGRKIINVYYQNRIDAAVALYMAGKIDFIIVSGDKSRDHYNEPAIMRDDLLARGVPGGRIFMDNAGFRTLDSILRCRDIFGQDHITIISQEFHNQRALFIANHKGVTAIAYNAKDGQSFGDAIIREKLARVKMGFDLLLNKQASYYGERVEIP
jgi:SanA protein